MSNYNQLNDPLYMNWLKTCLGLKNLKEGIEDFVENEVKVCHSKLLKNICKDLGVAYIDCSAQNFYGFPLKSLPHGNCGLGHSNRPQNCPTTCPNYLSWRIYTEICKLHRFGPTACSYKNTNASSWTSDPWQLAKCFLSTTGYASCNGPKDTDCTGLLSIIINLKDIGPKLQLNIDGKTDIVFQIRNIRNLLMHSSSMSASVADFHLYFTKLESFLNTLYGQGILGRANTDKEKLALNNIKELTAVCFHVLPSTELLILKESLDTIRKIQTQQRNDLVQQNESVHEQRTDIKQLQLDTDKLECMVTKIGDAYNSVCERDIQQEKRINELENKRIPENIKRQYTPQIEVWKADDKDFIETRASTYLRSLTKVSTAVAVLGIGGVGKTSLIHHEALRLRQIDGSEIIPITNPADISKYYCNNNNQIFVADNFLGETFLSRTAIEMWASDIANIALLLKGSNSNITEDENVRKQHVGTPTRNKKTLLLVSSRKHIFNEAKDIAGSEFKKLKLQTCDLMSENISLNENECFDIVRHYVPQHEETLKHSNILYPYVPLLCKLARDNPSLDTNHLFASPPEIFQNEIEQMKRNNPSSYCCICLLIICDGTFDPAWLDSTSSIPNDRRYAISSLLDEFGLKLNSQMNMENLASHFDILEGSFLKMRERMWCTLYTPMYEMLCQNIAQKLFRVFLKLSNARFVADRYVFESVLCVCKDNNKFPIIVKPEFEELFFHRLETDIQECCLVSSFENNQLSHDTYRKKFIQYCEKSTQIKRTLFKLCSMDMLTTSPFAIACTSGLKDIVDMLITLKCTPNVKDKSNKTPLHLAASNGHIQIVHVLLENEVNITLKDKNGNDALHYASQNGNTEIVEMLLSKGTHMKVCDKVDKDALCFSLLKGQESNSITPHDEAFGEEGNKALHAAARNGNYAVVQMLLKKKGIDMTFCDNIGHNALHIASLAGQVNIVKILLDWGIDIKSCNKYGHNALHNACCYGHDMVVKLLLDNGIDITARDKEGHTALHIASQRGHVNIVKILLDWGIDITVCNRYGHTALHNACCYGHDMVVKLLLDNGIDITARDMNGHTALHVASERGHVNIVKILLDTGIDITVCNKYGHNALHNASCQGQDRVAQILLDKGIDITVCDKQGTNALHIAAKEGQEQCVEVLLHNNIDMTVCDNFGRNALHFASSAGFINIVKILLDRGIDITVCNVFGHNALHNASCEGYTNIVKLLIEKGIENSS